MPTNPAKPQVPPPESAVIQWLLDADPAIRWQVLRDLIGAPAKEVAAERA
ncbi:MAG: squalene cyclase, partial [Chloroflexi bacterium]|nr:squalene cyclase [Chloroflexota bacterium]